MEMLDPVIKSQTIYIQCFRLKTPLSCHITDQTKIECFDAERIVPIYI